MDWIKVARALDNEWDSRRRVAEMEPNRPDASRQRLLADIAFMLRDCLVAGMSPEDREKLDRS